MKQLRPTRRSDSVCIVLICAGLVFTTSTVIWLAVQLPDDAPLGGPDEPMHRSLVDYLVRHSRWPSWDSHELERYSNGNSYATGSSLGYWVEAMLLRATGVRRLSGILLLLVCLSIVGRFARDCPTAGLLGIAAFTPQVVFTFSYVNSDAWSATIMLVLGIAVARFRLDPTSTRNIVLLVVFAAACLTCRRHVWAVGFLGFVYVLFPRLSPVILKNPKAAGLALAPALLIAAWWPVTSYLANDGDLIGLASGRKARILFGDPSSPSLAKTLSEIDLPVYLSLIARSFYAAWGWATMFLELWSYLLALLLAAAIIGWLCWRLPRCLPMFLLFPLANFLLLLVYSTTYDYQWQGRLLFPSFFLLLGIVLEDLTRRNADDAMTDSEQAPSVSHWGPVILLTGLVGLNMLSTVSLAGQVRNEKTAYVSHGLHFLQVQKYDKAIARFEQALKINPRDAAAHNGLGLVRAERGDAEAARRHFEKAIGLDPGDPAAYMNLGRAFLSQREIERAIEQFEAASRLAPDSAAVYFHLAGSYWELGDVDAAITNCRKALEIEPDHEEGQAMLNHLENQKRGNIVPSEP